MILHLKALNDMKQTRTQPKCHLNACQLTEQLEEAGSYLHKDCSLNYSHHSGDKNTAVDIVSLSIYV